MVSKRETDLTKGAREIASAARKMTEQRGLRVHRVYWGSGGEVLPHQATHTLTVETEKREKARGVFDQQWISDFHGPVGHEKSMTVLQQMVERLGRS